jgi:molecular chaperone GrpE
MADSNPNPNDESAAGGQSPADASLQDQLDAARQERDENFNRFLKCQAEFDTARRRWAKEFEEEKRFQSLPLVRDLLPALDNLHRTVEAAKSATSAETLKSGVEMVLKQIDDILAKHGAKPIVALGQTLDPHVHEAITQMPGSGKPPMTVLIEAEKGYTMHDRVIRPSKVVVAAP